MTREEENRKKERSQAAENYGNTKYSDGINSLICAEDFLAGAKWADQHPRKGLWNAEKVIEWLNSVDFSNYVENLSVIYVGQLKHDLIKAMEE